MRLKIIKKFQVCQFYMTGCLLYLNLTATAVSIINLLDHYLTFNSSIQLPVASSTPGHENLMEESSTLTRFMVRGVRGFVCKNKYHSAIAYRLFE